jgi:hypothetical protein
METIKSLFFFRNIRVLGVFFLLNGACMGPEFGRVMKPAFSVRVDATRRQNTTHDHATPPLL